MGKIKAFVTGITGQDGSYLAELLLKQGYIVHGVVRRSSSFNRGRIEHLYKLNGKETNKFHLHYGDVSDALNIVNLIKKIEPDEIYHLGAQSHVSVSFELPGYTSHVDALGTLNILESIKLLGFEKKMKFYNASTSELYGNVLDNNPQDENTPFNPQSPYAVAKLYSYHLTQVYKESIGLFACNGILFNHESPRRGENFITRKITLSIANILSGKQDKLHIGNLEAKRDWGYAPEYVEAMYLMLQQDEPDNYVIATGETHSVREFIEQAFQYVGIEIEWEGKNENEVGKNLKTGETLVVVDKKYFRPLDVNFLMGDYSKAKDKLNWKPKTKFKDLVKIIMQADLDLIRKN